MDGVLRGTVEGTPGVQCPRGWEGGQLEGAGDLTPVGTPSSVMRGR